MVLSTERILQVIRRSPYAAAVDWSYPASPPLGFPNPRVCRRRKSKQGFDAAKDGDCSSAEVLDGADVGGAVDTAYSLPGELIHLTLYGEIRKCQILKRKLDEASGICIYRKADGIVAIKLSNRKKLRHLHDDEKMSHRHEPFPENPWKEVAALQYLYSASGCHPNVIHLLDVMYDDDYLYEILPCYSQSLYWLIHGERSLTKGLQESIARRYFVQLLDAIHFLHSHGICHRDISSQNLLLNTAGGETVGCLVLIDFGMCLRVPYSYPDDHYTEDATNAFSEVNFSPMLQRRLIHSQSHCGKLRFMAPEIYNCESSFDGLAVDLWSAAVVLFEMLAGKLPYQKPHNSDPGYHDLMDKYYYWDRKKINPVLSWGHRVSDEAVDLLKHMFRPNPGDRLTLAQVASHSWVTKREE